MNNGGLVYWALASLIATAEVIALDGAGAFFIRRLPESYFGTDSVLPMLPGEKKLYRKLGVKKWSRYVPELGLFTGFSKRDFKTRDDPEYLERFILESNYGVAIHFANAVFGYFILILPFGSEFSVGIPVAIVNFFLSLAPSAILRNNLKTLTKLYKRTQNRDGDSKEGYIISKIC